MKKNIGPLDRALRVIAAAMIGILLISGAIPGALAIVLGVFAAIFLLTSAIRTCPLYLPFDYSTAKKGPTHP